MAVWLYDYGSVSVCTRVAVCMWLCGSVAVCLWLCGRLIVWLLVLCVVCSVLCCFRKSLELVFSFFDLDP